MENDTKKPNFINLICNVVKPQSISMQLLLERIKRNEETQQSVLIFAKNKWCSKKTIIEQQTQDSGGGEWSTFRGFRKKRTNAKNCQQFSIDETTDEEENKV